MKRTKCVGIIALVIMVIFAVSFTGCSKDQQSLADVSASGEQSSNEDVTYELLLSYANMDYIETGDETQPKLIRNIDAEISLPEEDLEAAAMSAVNELKTVPNELESEGKAVTMVDDNISIKTVSIDGDTCIIDLAGDGLDSLDMYQEMYFIYQITDTLLSSFDEINGVKFTVDGNENAELTYMSIDKTFTKSEVDEFMQ